MCKRPISIYLVTCSVGERVTVSVVLSEAGGYKEMSPILADQYRSALVFVPKCGGEGELRGLSQGVQLYTWAQTNFGDLTPYLTYGPKHDGFVAFVDSLSERC